MSENTKIEWADHTFNPWEGCQKVGPGCDNCYAEARNARFAGGKAVNWGPGAPRRRTSAANWDMPRRWNAKAKSLGIRYRVFCASLADVFDIDVDPAWRSALFALIFSTPHLDWLLLTKRIGNVKAMLPFGWECGAHPNIWIGATIVNQQEADRDIPKLLALPAFGKRFLSMEPLLGYVDLSSFARSNGQGLMRPLDGRFNRLDWVIVGGESGPNARPMHPEWAAQLRNQCKDAGVSYLFKQWGEWVPEAAMNHAMRMKDFGQFESLLAKLDGQTHWIDKDDHIPFDASDVRMVKVGKKAAGRLLDGREWNEVPA